MFKVHEIPEMFWKPYRAQLNEENPPQEIYSRFDDMSVTVNGVDCPVRRCRVSALPFNRIWPGRYKQRDAAQSELAGFITAVADEPLEFTVGSVKEFAKAVVRPLGKGIEAQIRDGKACFTLPGPGQYVLELGSVHNCLHIFIDPPEEAPKPEECTHYFGPGFHFPGTIKVQDNDRIYFHPEAWVFGSIYGENVHNVKISGAGILDNSCEERIVADGHHWANKSCIKFYNSSNVTVEGISLLDACCWCVAFYYCSDILLDRIKVVGQWRYNSDGLDICNCQRFTFRNSFIRAFDDVITLKGVDYWFVKNPIWQGPAPIEDITVQNCVLWCDWGRTCTVGIETSATVIRNIIFENCDLIHNSASALDIQNGMEQDVTNVIFRNITVEYQADTLPEIYQVSDDMVYDANASLEGNGGSHYKRKAAVDTAGKPIGLPMLINSENHHFWPDDSIRYAASIDVLYENIQVFAEEGVPLLPVRIKSWVPETKYGTHTIRNLTVNGKRITDKNELDWDCDDTNIILE